MLEVKVTREQGVAIVELNGRLDGLGAGRLDAAAAELGSDAAWVVVDFTRVDFVSSAGLRSLLKLQRQLAALAGGAVLAGLSALVRQPLEMSGLLRFYTLAEDMAGARAEAQRRQQALAGLAEKTVNGRSYAVSPQAGAASVLDVWGGKTTGAESLTRATLAELDLAFGVGGFGGTAEQAATALGEFISIRRAAGVVPADGHCVPDFIVVTQPEQGELFVQSGVGISGAPAAIMEIESHKTFTLAELVADCRTLAAGLAEGNKAGTLGLVVYAPGADYRGAHYASAADLAAGKQATAAKKTAGIFYVGVAAGLPLADDFAPLAAALPAGTSLHGHAFELTSAPALNESPADLAGCVAGLATLDQLQGVSHAQDETRLTAARVWLFLPTVARNSAEKQVTLEVIGEGAFREEWAVLTRRIYHDCGKVVLTRLCGGFTSQTFRVVSYARDGRAQLPTVLKIGSRAVTDREVAAYRACVEKYILNNSTTIMGEAACGEWAGLRYNFVGVTGADSKLVWLEDLYRTEPMEKLLAIFDRVFTDVLKPWYGQPKFENITPYAMHDPARLFFKNIVADAKKELGIDADEPLLDCPPLGRKLPNPYHFYKNEYPKRHNKARAWYTGIIHGDLNLKNILVDEKENLYIIDFSECRVANILSDFARLEPIVMCELTSVKTEQDLAELVEMEQGLASVAKLGDQPPLTYRGSDPMAAKAHATICRMRRYADQCTVFETDLTPYLLAVLEWTLPVVSYTGLPKLRMQLAAYRAALIVEQLQRLERGK